MSAGDVLSALLAVAFWVFVISALVERLRSGTLVRDPDGRFSVVASVAIVVAGIAGLALVVTIVT